MINCRLFQYLLWIIECNVNYIVIFSDLNYPQYLPRGAQPQVVASAPQNLQQVPPPTLPLPPASQQQLGQQKKRRAKAIPIIDPESGKLLLFLL